MTRNNKGITLIILVITVTLLLMISGAAIYSIKMSPDTNKVGKMVNDINLLRGKVLTYYNRYGSIPIVNEESPTPINTSKIPIDQKNDNDDPNGYYEIDISKLENLTLNYGKRNGATDIYIINISTLKIYYLKGVEYVNSGTILYTIVETSGTTD